MKGICPLKGVSMYMVTHINLKLLGYLFYQKNEIIEATLDLICKIRFHKKNFDNL